jgi:hypothetical protein
LNGLEKLHPDFYPVPFVPTFGTNSLHLGPPSATTAYITKQELIQLYGKCGDSLHRGNVKKLLKQNQPLVNEPYKDIISSGQKILNLLTTHRISRIGNLFHFLAFLSLTAPGSNQATVQVAIAESPQPKQSSS